ncbi:sugar transferase [Eubacterium coprostanoligenes]|uniref:Sugar transferase involved in LPS biosynthesis (Colanic, teichoic acid) n=1 Tax=Eubacterium coprostanoligenes TaxID=290054 RepID=A0A1T4KDH3_9FIRM|nr:sugar transferase [Eubacterium coprostanoligenes]SJZ40484.1 Sugar transferase involved in LPS biosynthesis (colanic, teichoic acid) [Eubacterium coprostanoligenes]
MYRYIKRFFDIVSSFLALMILLPLMLILTIVGTFVMKGNPFFTQQRPGKDEKIFRLIKFRTMTNAKDKDGNLLPDADRLTKYGEFLRTSSLDELPELFNIIKGDMSVIGPRPLLVKYLPRYNEHQHRRHEVRPGLSGWAQVNGRNTVSWEDKFNMDVEYVDNYSLIMDIKILIMTVKNVLKREGISSDTSATMEEFMGLEADNQEVNV